MECRGKILLYNYNYVSKFLSQIRLKTSYVFFFKIVVIFLLTLIGLLSPCILLFVQRTLWSFVYLINEPILLVVFNARIYCTLPLTKQRGKAQHLWFATIQINMFSRSSEATGELSSSELAEIFVFSSTWTTDHLTRNNWKLTKCAV